LASSIATSTPARQRALGSRQPIDGWMSGITPCRYRRRAPRSFYLGVAGAYYDTAWALHLRRRGPYHERPAADEPDLRVKPKRAGAVKAGGPDIKSAGITLAELPRQHRAGLIW
jgi:hypothetical protein